MTPSDPSGVHDPYDWDNYKADWKSSPAYEEQEALLRTQFDNFFFTGSRRDTRVLEVGPGFGRITKLVADRHRSQISTYTGWDVSALALTQAQVHAQLAFNASIVGPLQNPYLGVAVRHDHFDLVIAIEVLMHIPPQDVRAAIANLYDYLAPGGTLITCDWTKPLDPNIPIRDGNFLHDYFEHWIAGRPDPFKPAHLTFRPITCGLQTIFVVRKVG